MNIDDWMSWLNTQINNHLDERFELKFVSDSNGDLGDLRGIQFDSEEKGGYVYFWSNGYVGFQLMDYQSMNDIVKDSTVKLDDDQYIREVLVGLLNHAK